MRFGLFYELQLPRPWDDGSEHRVVKEALEQVELADRLGFDTVWEVEHHFLEEYSHSSAPEVFLAAASQRTNQIKLGHGIVALPPAYNHPARVTERIGMLDLVSDGRAIFGTGETSSNVELQGFGVPRGDKRAMWEESLDVIVRMMTEASFTGVDGKYVTVPRRNVIPKPLQKPHPPIWVACSRRETITLAAQKGIGALSFSFIEPSEAKEWVDHYYSTLAAEGVAAGRAVNPNLAVVTGFFCDEDEQRAIDNGIDGAHFFAYSLAHYYVPGSHRPGVDDIWTDFVANREVAGMSKEIVKAAGSSLTAKVELERYEAEKEEQSGLERGSLKSLRGAVGTPDQIREFVLGYEEAGSARRSSSSLERSCRSSRSALHSVRPTSSSGSARSSKMCWLVARRRPSTTTPSTSSRRPLTN